MFCSKALGLLLKRIEALRRQVQPQMAVELDKIREEVSEVLNPEQREQWQKLFDHLRRTWVPLERKSKKAE